MLVKKIKIFGVLINDLEVAKRKNLIFNSIKLKIAAQKVEVSLRANDRKQQAVYESRINSEEYDSEAVDAHCFNQ